jgi:adenylate kinase family enzyme
MINIIFVMGPTNVGKSHFINKMASEAKNVGLVEVGKYLRAKYPPEKFEGQMDFSELKAENIMIEHIEHRIQEGFGTVIVDGQPRSDVQVDRAHDFLTNTAYPVNPVFVLLECPDEIRRERMLKRDKNNSDLQLSQARFQRDKDQYVAILDKIRSLNHPIETIDTSKELPHILQVLT